MAEENESFNLQARIHALHEVGRFKESLPLIHQAITLEPENGRLYCLLSYAFYHLEEFQEAMKWADKAVALDPQREWGHRLRSVTLVHFNRSKEALEAARVAVELEPDGLYSLSNLAELLIIYKKLNEAEIVAERLLSLAPEEGMTHRTCAYLHLNRKRFKEAEESARRAITLDPENARGLRLLGDALSRQKQARDAIDVYIESLKRDPTDSETRRALAMLAMKYFGTPISPFMVGGIALLLMIAAGINHLTSIHLSGWVAKGWGWITVRHGLEHTWCLNEEFEALPENTRNLILDVCRSERSAYLDALPLAYWSVAICIYLAVLALYYLLRSLFPGA